MFETLKSAIGQSPLSATIVVEPGGASRAERVAALHRTGLLDSTPEAVFDRLTELVTKVLGVPIALVSLVDSDRQFFKSQSGLPAPLSECRQTDLERSFCQYVTASGSPLVIPDARLNPVVRGNLAITEFNVVAYLGVPLRAAGGESIGALCAIDNRPRSWTPAELEVLQALAGAVTSEIVLREHLAERARTEHELRVAKETAEAASIAKDRFLATLSHEMRTPLTPVLMGLSSMEDEASANGQPVDQLQMMRRNVELEIKLIDDLLDLSRITTGKLSLHLRPIAINDLLKHVCESCSDEANDKKVDFDCDLDSAAGYVLADAGRLQQVIWNLAKNALKFTPAGGKITLESMRAKASTIGADGSDNGGVATNGDDRVRIMVRDTGIGIPADSLTKIFDAFEQGDSAVTRRFGGLGLGLAISKTITELHQGTLHVESAGSAMGATFVLEFPSATPPQPRPDATTPATGATSQSRGPVIRLLLVEDHPDTARVLSRLLSANGHEVKVAGCVADAISIAGGNTFDIVVSDVGLPDATGYELMEQLTAKYKLKGIALSGFGMEADILRSRQAGFSEHLVKPVSFAQLQTAIRRVVATES